MLDHQRISNNFELKHIRGDIFGGVTAAVISLPMALAVVMIAGVFQIILGALTLGKYITLMPYSVISGFMSGTGLILVLLQIAPFLG